VEGELGLRRAHHSMLPQFTLPGQSTRDAGVNGSTKHGRSTSCVVARAAGKPSGWPMGVQARSGADAGRLRSLATP
jgi:hypothetical protein